MMNFKFSKLALYTCQIFAISCLLSGCAAHFGIKSHRSYASKAASMAMKLPTVTLELGETIRGITPAKGLGGGYWHAIYVENPDIARHLPREGSFIYGTDIEAVGKGKTKAYYGNAVYMQNEDALDYYREGDWFWIDVIEPKSER